MSDVKVYLDDLRALMRNDAVKDVLADKYGIIDMSIDILSIHINIMINAEEITDNYNSKVYQALNIIVEKFCDSTLPKEFIEFCRIYSDVVYNWNNNYCQINEISNLCKLLYKCVDLYKKAHYLLENAKALMSKFTEVNNFIPPVFELNKKHLEVLLEEK